jgi:hypothetical protein
MLRTKAHYSALKIDAKKQQKNEFFKPKWDVNSA